MLNHPSPQHKSNTEVRPKTTHLDDLIDALRKNNGGADGDDFNDDDDDDVFGNRGGAMRSL